MTFRTERDRDAWPTIRGFVYQVELSVLEWLQLGLDEALELERGEDIDKITRGLGDSEERLLEQIKHRVDHITLNSASSLPLPPC